VAAVTFEAVTKKFGDVVVLDGFDLTVHDGEFLVLLGPSGCGKTTALRTVAGLESPTSGRVLIDAKAVDDIPPQKRDVAMVFQSYALYPHMTVAKNIGYPLRHRRSNDQHGDEARVREVAELLGLTPYLGRKPRDLSGGQRQRVALARAIVRDPKVFLMDEPLSNLDASLRTQTRGEIVQLQRNLGATTIYVTHDQVEAMTMGHRIAVLSDGRLQQVGTPEELYEDPINSFVASFIGNPGMNLLPAHRRDNVICISDVAAIQVDGHDCDLHVGVRAEQLALVGDGIPASCLAVEALGSEVQVLVELAGGAKAIVRQPSTSPRPTLGGRVSLALTTPQPLLFDMVTTERIRVPG